jgi:hypothetical protein
MDIKTAADFRRAIRMGQYAWPGGYEIYYITSDCGVLCVPCANKERRTILSSIVDACDDGWRVVAADAVCNTDSEVRCDNCYRVLQEEYMPEEPQPRTTGNMAAELRDRYGRTRTIAVPPNLTHGEAVVWVSKYQAPHEVIAQFVQYS